MVTDGIVIVLRRWYARGAAAAAPCSRTHPGCAVYALMGVQPAQEQETSATWTRRKMYYHDCFAGLALCWCCGCCWSEPTRRLLLVYAALNRRFWVLRQYIIKNDGILIAQ
jgi:hypothetical protein